MRHLLLAGGLLVAAAGAAQAAEPPTATTRVYRIELVGGGIVWSDDAPLQSGEQILFHGHPPGALKSLKRSEIARIVALHAVPPAPAPVVRPGEAVDLGLAGPGSGGRTAPVRPVPARNAGPRQGEAKDGSALFNPDRTYKPEWDSKLIPGTTMPNPNSPNDYKEGRTLGYPPAPATQAAPGDPPVMKPSSGEPPKPPN